MNFKHPLGVLARDLISGYEGVVTARVEWYYGCLRYSLQAPGLKDGKPIEEIQIDEDQLKILNTELIPGEPREGTPFELESRARVRDVLTGYEGVITGRMQWLYSGNRYVVQSQALHDGKPVDSIVRHAKQLEVLGAGQAVGAIKGGPAPSVPRETVPRAR